MIGNWIKKHRWILLYASLASLMLVLAIYPTLLSSFRYDSDFARDISEIYDITQGNLRLIGPKLSFGGIFTGPFYYYLFAPVMFAFSGYPEVMLYFNLGLFAVGLFALTILMSKSAKWTAGLIAFLAAIWIYSSNYFIYAAKNPGNAFSYLPVLALLLAIYPKLLKTKAWYYWLAWGFIYGVVVNFHLISVITLISLGLTSVLFNLKNWQNWKSWLMAAVGFTASFAPLLLFELRHNFVMFKNTFIDKSYQIFTSNSNLPNPLTTSENPVINAGLLAGHFNEWVQLKFIVIILALIVIAGYLVINKLASYKKASIQMSLASLFAFLLLAVVARSQLAFHYFYPFLLFTQIGLVYLVYDLKIRWQYVILGLLVAINLISWPQRFFTPSHRTIDDYRIATKEIISNQEITSNLNNKPFNVFVIRETSLAVLGWEYRYFLKVDGLKPMGIQQYNQSQLLLLVDEKMDSDIEHAQSWELDQFGQRNEVLQAEITGRKVYVFTNSSY